MFPQTTATQRINYWLSPSFQYYLTTAKARSSFKEESVIDFFNKHKDSNDVYVRFTSLPKFGLNPDIVNTFDTPAGIFAFQCKASVEKYGLKNDPTTPVTNLGCYVNFPFAADSKFAHFFTYKSSLRLVDSTSYSNLDFSNDVGLLIKAINQKSPEFFTKFNSYYSKFYKRFESSIKSILAKFELDQLSMTPSEAFVIAKALDETSGHADYSKLLNTYFGALWSLTHNIARMFSKITGLTNSKQQSLWTSLFRMIGIGGCRDNGLGVIHENEPAQTVIFSASYCTLLKTLPNKVSLPVNESLWTIDPDKALVLWSHGRIPFPEDSTNLTLNFTANVSPRAIIPDPLLAQEVTFQNFKGNNLPKVIKSSHVEFANLETSKLPDDLQSNFVKISDCPNVTTLPHLTHPYSLTITDTPIKELPQYPVCIERIFLSNTKITTIPDTIIDCRSLTVDANDIHLNFDLPSKYESVTNVNMFTNVLPYTKFMKRYSEFTPRYDKGDLVNLVPKDTSRKDSTGTVTNFYITDNGFITYQVELADGNKQLATDVESKSSKFAFLIAGLVNERPLIR